MNQTSLTAGVCLLMAASLSCSAQIYYFEVPLEGSQEFPGPGDPDGSGLARLWFDPAANSVTWDLTVADIDAFTADHIHRAAAGASGPVQIDFAASLSGGPVIDPDVALLLADPSLYYVNVHNAAFPAGAIRGQLPAQPTAIVPEATGWLAMAGVGLVAALFGRGGQRRRQPGDCGSATPSREAVGPGR